MAEDTEDCGGSNAFLLGTGDSLFMVPSGGGGGGGIGFDTDESSDVCPLMDATDLMLLDSFGKSTEAGFGSRTGGVPRPLGELFEVRASSTAVAVDVLGAPSVLSGEVEYMACEVCGRSASDGGAGGGCGGELVR